MITKIYRVTDLGPGDGGKGGIIQALTQKVNAKLVIKEGGAQGSHGVVGRYGNFCFSQWGCGTLDRVPTYLSPNFVMSPTGIILEAEALEMFDPGLKPFSLISVAGNCVCATPYHQAWSNLYELLLKDKPHGTVGTGVGKAFKEFLESPNRVIYANELKNEFIVREKLKASREFLLKKYSGVYYADVLPKDIKRLHESQEILNKDEIFEDIVKKFLFVGEKLVIEHFEDVLKRFNGNALIERSHGVLTDRKAGFKPHVSNLRTLPNVSDEMLKNANWTGQVINLGVHRAYEIRHGAGPMPTTDDKIRASLLPNSHKMANRWQGEVRVGALDVNLLRYALNACGGADYFDGLCITWFDQIIKNKEWKICTHYLLDGKIYPENGELTTEILNRVEPVITSLIIPELSQNELVDWCQEVLSNFIGLPVRLVSLGPAPEHKIFI
ncbi:MAG: adenylosuccinate synthetase [Candidatus Saccharibacteria bacterium]|nr:adenylosuccinate synthetase [Candidatus Saccharibacteria bacterium]